MPTAELFKDDAYLKECRAVIENINEQNGIILDQTVFFAKGGGQQGDRGWLCDEDGRESEIVTTVREGDIIHVPKDAPSSLSKGSVVVAKIDWETRHRLMRLHTAMHLLCSLVPCGVTGGQIIVEKARLDFDAENFPLDKEKLTEELNRLVGENHPVSIRWIEQKDLDQTLVRTVDVMPPESGGRIRLVEIGTVDCQPCGGTHVKSTAEIGRLIVPKIENKGRRNKRVNIKLA